MIPTHLLASSMRGIRQYVVYISFLAILLFFSIALHDRGFLSLYNLMNILRQTAMVSIMAVGMTFALAAREIDLSIGSLVSLSALVTAVILSRLNSIPLAILASLGVGVITGLVNGFITTKARIPAILATLGTAGVLSGLARSITNSETIPILNGSFNSFFGSGDLGPFSSLLIWTILIIILGHTLLKHTSFGRAVLATGGNLGAARYSGIRTDSIRIAALVICSLTASIAGILYAGRLHSARYALGESDLMTVIAAAIIGGTSFTGGRGTVIGAVVGSILMGMLNNGLLLLGLSGAHQMIAQGIIIVIAITLSRMESQAA
ncbi:MAG: ABC transporter permease [Spirochaetia bacterium]|jgi:ribose transport system permease protein